MINLRKEDPVADAVKEILQQEALKGNQHKIDKNKNNKIDAEDFKILRKEENVDEALKGNQHKIDKNKNNKIDAEDFKILRKEETVEEGLKDIVKKAFKTLTGGSDEDQRKDLQRKMGVPQTGKKPTQKEEVEQIDEISTKLLAKAADAASDPDSDYHYGKSHDAQKFADHAKKTKDAKSAAAVQGAADAKGHYPRDNHTYGSDKLTQRQSPRVTSSGKANKQDIKSLKSKLRKEEVQGKTLKQFKEGWDEMLADVKKRGETQPNGGSGVKQGSRYGGSKQKDKPEQETDEKK